MSLIPLQFTPREQQAIKLCTECLFSLANTKNCFPKVRSALEARLKGQYTQDEIGKVLSYMSWNISKGTYYGYDEKGTLQRFRFNT